MLKADLHCHSNCSDGSLTPQELVLLAKERGLWGLSITDHDTIEAYEKAIPAAKEEGIRLGTGVEFSCEHLGISIHLLGYDFLLTNAGIREFCARHQTRRKERNLAMLKQLNKKGVLIKEEELLLLGKGKTIGRPHIAQLMEKKGYVSSLREAFDKYLAEGKCCYVSGESFSLQETIDVIHQAGGKAFLAHPHLIPKTLSLKEVLRFPLDGIESYYSKMTGDQVKPWLALVQKKGLLFSGGSDFHGSAKPEVSLGASFVTKEIFEKIFEHPVA